MTSVRLFVTDLDGTFLDDSLQVSDLNAHAVRQAAAAGVPTVFATGRPARWLDVLEPLTDAHPLVLASNGAVIYDLARHRVVEAALVDPEVALRVARRIRAEVPDIVFGVEHGISWGAEPAYRTRGDNVAPDDVGDIEHLVRTPFVKLLAVGPTCDTETLARRVAPLVGEDLTMTWSFLSPAGLLEISAPGVTKARGVLRLCADLNVDPATAVAFGDMPNDAAMLSAVGRGFVMSDAHPSLRDAGFADAGAHTDSGVGRTMLRLLHES